MFNFGITTASNWFKSEWLRRNLLELDLSSTMLTGSVLTTVKTVGVEFWLTTVRPWPPEEVIMWPLLVIICELGVNMWLWGAKICPEGKICALFIICGWYWALFSVVNVVPLFKLVSVCPFKPFWGCNVKFWPGGPWNKCMWRSSKNCCWIDGISRAWTGAGTNGYLGLTVDRVWKLGKPGLGTDGAGEQAAGVSVVNVVTSSSPNWDWNDGSVDLMLSLEPKNWTMAS